MELRDYIAIARKWWWLLLLGVVMGATGGLISNSFKTITYQARTTLVIGNSAQSLHPDDSQLAASQRLGQIYADMITREPILRAASESLDLGLGWTAIRDKVRGHPVPETQFFELYVTDTDPRRAKLLADEIARQLVLQNAISNEPSAHEIFVRGQLGRLEAKIAQAEQQIQELQTMLEVENTAEGIRRRQEEIASLEAKIDAWQNNYASLLAFIEDDESVSTLSVIEPAMVPSSPINAGGFKNVVLAAVVGALLSGGLAFLLEYLDDTIKTSGDVEWVLGWPTLATIIDHPRPLREYKDRVIVARSPFSPVAEAYRSLRTSLEFAELPNPTALLISSLAPGEGKTITATNLAVAMAQAGQQVILVDADLRHPMIDKIFELPNEVGVSNLLLSRDISLEEALVTMNDESLQILTNHGLRVLTSGPPPPNPAELVGSPRMASLMERLKQLADVVIFDSPPLLAVTDARLLVRRVDAMLLVLEAGRNRVQGCLRAKEILKQINVEPLGVVLNRLTSKHSGGYYYYNYHAYYPAGTNGRRPQKKERPLLKRLTGR